MNVIYLTKNYGIAWELMPVALSRITAFSERYETDATAEYLCKKLVASFTSDCPGLMCFLLSEKGQIVGHVLCGLDEWCGRKLITILQYEVDGPGDPAIIARSLTELEKWARAIGADGWQAICRNATLARVFRTYYGFEESGILVRKAFSPSAEIPSRPPAEEGRKMPEEPQP